MDQQRAQHHGGDDVSGNAQRDHDDQRAARSCVIGRLRRDDSIYIAGAKFFRLLGIFFGLVIGENVRDGTAGGRQDARENADQRRHWRLD